MTNGELYAACCHLVQLKHEMQEAVRVRDAADKRLREVIDTESAVHALVQRELEERTGGKPGAFLIDKHVFTLSTGGFISPALTFQSLTEITP